jgi:hypothetical protein
VSSTLSGVTFIHKVIFSRNNPPYARLTGSSALRGEFAVRREGSTEGFFKSIGFAGEAQTGDAAFDAEFYLFGRSQEYLRAFFSDPRNRAAIRALFELGFDSVTLRDGWLVATRHHPPMLLELEALRAAIEQFAALGEPPAAMSVAMKGIGGVSTAHIKAALVFTLFFATGTWFVVAGVLNPMIDGSFALYVDSWRQGLLACVLLLVAAAFALRGRAAAPKELAMITLIGVLLWSSGAGLATAANQYLDQSPVLTAQVRLLALYATSGRNPSHRLVFSSWENGRSRIDINVSRSVYERVQDNQTWVIQVRAGRFGYPWVSALAPLRQEH